MTGHAPHGDSDAAVCPKCEGTGRYRDPRIWGTMPGSATCDRCDGTGKVSRPAKPSVPPPVPPGVREAWGVGGAGPGRPPAPDGGSNAAPATGWVLGPCSRPGRRVAAGSPADDWWREPHVYCTGSHHIGPGEPVVCKCPCHGAHPVLRCPQRYDSEAACTCPGGHHCGEAAAHDAWVAEVEKDAAMIERLFSEAADV